MARRTVLRKLRNAAIFAALGYAVSALDVVLPALAAAWAWFETDDDDKEEAR